MRRRVARLSALLAFAAAISVLAPVAVARKRHGRAKEAKRAGAARKKGNADADAHQRGSS